MGAELSRASEIGSVVGVSTLYVGGDTGNGPIGLWGVGLPFPRGVK